MQLLPSVVVASGGSQGSPGSRLSISISFSGIVVRLEAVGHAGRVRRAGRRAVLGPEQRVAGVVHAVVERDVRREVLADRARPGVSTASMT